MPGHGRPMSTRGCGASLLTWPPTVFTIDLAATVKAPDNRTIRQFKVQGEGRAEFDEFKKDFYGQRLHTEDI